MIEATQAYGIESEPPETELQAEVQCICSNQLIITYLNTVIMKTTNKPPSTQAYIFKSQLVFSKGN